MRSRHLIIVALLLCACKAKKPIQTATTAQWAPPPPVGFVGHWVHVAPTAYRADTLTLRADSSARGRVPHFPAYSDMAAATRWKVMFIAHAPPAARADWWGGYGDGGEYSCYSKPGEHCRSGPLLCVGNAQQYSCLGFKFTRDSLALATGDRYIRAKPAAAAHHS